MATNEIVRAVAMGCICLYLIYVMIFNDGKIVK